MRPAAAVPVTAAMRVCGLKAHAVEASLQGALTPRQRPNRHGRYHRAPGGRCQRHVVDPRGAPGLAAQQPRQRHPAAAPQPETLDRLVAIDRTGRQMAAVVADQRRQRVPVDPDQGAPGVARQPLRPRWRSPGTMLNEAMNASWAACCNHVRGFARFQGMEPRHASNCATLREISHALGGGAAKVLWTMSDSPRLPFS